MSFKYTKEWENKLFDYLMLIGKGEGSREEDSKFNARIDEAYESEDIRVVEILVHTLYYKQFGTEQSIYGVLSTINYKIYYEGVFKKLNELDLENTYNLEKIILVLHQIDGMDIDLKVEMQLNDILKLADKYLDLKTVEILCDGIEKWGYEEEDEKLFPQINDYFNERIKKGK